MSQIAFRLQQTVRKDMGGALQSGPGGPWHTQNFGWLGHKAFRSNNNWPMCSLILRKIRKIGATRYPILRLKCIPLGLRLEELTSYSAPPDPLAVFMGQCMGAYF